MLEISGILKNVEPAHVLKGSGIACQREQETSAQWAKEPSTHASTEGEPVDVTSGRVARLYVHDAP